MKKITITISEELAGLIAKQQQDFGHSSFDDTVAALLNAGLVVARRTDDDPDLGYSTEELQALIQEGDDSGPAEPFDPSTFRAEVLRLSAELTKKKS